MTSMQYSLNIRIASACSQSRSSTAKLKHSECFSQHICMEKVVSWLNCYQLLFSNHCVDDCANHCDISSLRRNPSHDGDIPGNPDIQGGESTSDNYWLTSLSWTGIISNRISSFKSMTGKWWTNPKSSFGLFKIWIYYFLLLNQSFWVSGGY